VPVVDERDRRPTLFSFFRFRGRARADFVQGFKSSLLRGDDAMNIVLKERHEIQ
jgi:hypothetical protein